MKLISIFVVFYLIFILSFNVNAEVHAGIIKNTKSLYSFVSHFCYSKGQRFLNVTAFTTTNNGQKLGLMNKQSWDSLNNKMTCTEIESKTIQQFTIENNKNQLFAVNIDSISWWYLVGYNCNPDLSFSYEVTWTDGNGFWEKQFSYDEQGLGQLYICFTVFYFIALGIHIYGCLKLQAEKSYHQIVKMVTIAFSVELFAQLMLSIHYGVYARNGEGIFSFLFIGQILDLTGDLLMILSVTLIAQGYAKNSMSIQQQKITFIILAVNLVIYVAMDIWKISGNRSSVNYLYDTAPGGIILTIRMLLFVYFLFAIINTIKEEQIQKKINFYVKFAVFTGVWFVFLPICALIALGMPSYSRLVFISAILVTIDYIGFVGLGVLMWPTFIHNFFVVKQVNVVDFSESEDLNEEDPL